MSTPWRLFLDQNVRYEVKASLAAGGFDVVHATDVHMQTALDPAILQFSIDQHRTLVTHDAEFGNLNLCPLPHPHDGVIRLRVLPPVPSLVSNKLAQFLVSHEPEDIADSLVVITMSKVRIRRQLHR
jgi:predicted nuclease of predicted toxin-antitoxin system